MIHQKNQTLKFWPILKSRQLYRKQKKKNGNDLNGKGNKGDRNKNGKEKPKAKRQSKKNENNPKYQPPGPQEKPTGKVNGEDLYERIVKGVKFQCVQNVLNVTLNVKKVSA